MPKPDTGDTASSPSTQTLGTMTHYTTRLVHGIIYVGCALLSLYAGSLMSRALAAYLADHATWAFFVLLVMALAILLLGSEFENRLLWKGRFNQSSEVPQWVAKSRSNLLKSGAPSPLSLGFSLGLLLQLLL
jgi:hypothetical protein